MFCPECGRQNRDTAKFCVGCGEPTQELTAGTVLQGRYRIEGPLGSGAMGNVYRVHDQRLHCDRALKVLATPTGTDDERQEAVRRFEQEASIVSNLHHQSLPPVQDFFSEQGRHFIVQALIEGVNLEQYLRMNGKPGLPEDWVVGVALQLLAALEYLHQQTPPIVFRDLKPSNVMSETATGRVFLIDFGIARHSTGATGTGIGTEGYAPPEQYAGRAEPRSDLYALAATVHHLLSGRAPTPFHFEPIADLVSGVSGGVQALLAKGLQLNVNDRFSSAADMRSSGQSLGAWPAGYVNAQVENPGSMSTSPGHVGVGGAAGQEVTVHLPRDCSLGKLEVWKDDDWTLLGEACGDVVIRSDERVRLEMADETKDTTLVHLRDLPFVQAISLEYTEVTDAGLVHLASLTGLQSLCLDATQFTGVGLVHLKRLAGLRSLFIRGVKDAGLVHLKALKGLQELDLTWTEVTDAGLIHLKGLTGLRKLDLTGTKVTDEGLVHLKGLTGLRELDLVFTKVTDAGLVHLKGLNELQELSLWGSKVTLAGLDELESHFGDRLQICFWTTPETPQLLLLRDGLKSE